MLTPALIRARLHDGLSLVAVVGPLRPEVIAALPRAVETHLASAAAAELRRRLDVDGHTWRDTSLSNALSLAGDVVIRADDDVKPGDLALRLVDRGYPGLPISFMTSGAYAAAMLPHDLFDGTGSTAQFAAIIALAAGERPADRRLRTLRLPMLAAVRSTGLIDRSALAAARAFRRQAEESTATVPQFPAGLVPDRLHRRRGHSAVHLTPEMLDTVEARFAAEPTSGRSTSGMRLTQVVLEALAASVDAATDHRVRLAIDLRRYLPVGRGVTGPFSTAFPIGTLRTMDTSAGVLTSNVGRLLRSSAPLAALIGDVVGYLRVTRGRTGASAIPTQSPRTSVDINVSIIPAGLTESAWQPDLPRTYATLLLHPTQVSNPYVQITPHGNGVVVSVWDEVGVIAPDLFAAHILDRFDPAVVTTPVVTTTKGRQS